jgi:glycine/D-amino acid oxidase-like deaminating enzyme
MPEQPDYDVVVIGTGISGYCAALEALTAGARVLMVDAGEQIGGSSWFSTGIPITFDCFIRKTIKGWRGRCVVDLRRKG